MKRFLSVLICVLLMLCVCICSVPAFAEGWVTPPVPIDEDDCEHAFSAKIYPATASANGRIDTVCSKCGHVEKSVAIAKIQGVKLAATVYYYNGKAKTPAVIVKDANGKDIDSKYYTVKYVNNVKVGQKTYANITFKTLYSGACNRYFNIYLGKPAVSVKTSANAVKLSWHKIAGAKYYRIYQYNASTGKYTRLANTANLNCTLKNKAAGSTYYYLVRAYFINAANKEVLSPYTKADNVKAVTLCAAPAVKASVSGKNITLKWSAVSRAKYYRIFRYNPSTGKYTGVVNNFTGTSYVLKNQAAGTHWFLVRAFNAANAGSAYSANVLAKAVVK